MNTTTIKIPENCLAWWKACCRIKNKSSSKLFAEFMEVVKCRKQHDFYLSLAMPSGYKKPLFGKHIDKSVIKKKVFTKHGATCE